MNIGDIIKRLRKERGLTQEQLGNIIGVQKSAIAKYESGRVENLKRASIEKLANYFGVSPSYLLGINDDTANVLLPRPEPVTFINIYTPISCGNGAFSDDNIISTISVPTSMLPKNKKDLFAQYADGDSMIGKGIEDGDLLIFNKEQCESGDIGSFCIDENVATCKILKIVDRQIILMPANDKYDPIPVDPEKYKCVGKLVLKMERM